MDNPILDSAFLRRLDRLSLSTRRPFSGQMKGEKRSVKRGTSVEFADYREYALGDDLLYVDWNTAARLDKMYVKLFVEEEDLFLALLPDTSKSMDFGSPNKLPFAVSLAAAIGYIGLSNYDRVLVQPYADMLVRPLPTQRGKPGISPLFSYLSRIEAGGGTSFSTSLRRFAASSKYRGLAIVISDFFDLDWQAGLKSLVARGFQVTCLHTLSPEEIDPALRGDLRIIDSESGQSKEMSVSPQLLGRYREALAAFCAEIEAFCHRYGADYLRLSTDLVLEDVVLKTMRRQGIVR